MVPPKDANIIDWPTSISWFDENGIFCSVSKKVPAQTLEETKKLMNDLYRILDGKKICMLIDVTNSGESTRETREFAAQEFPKFIKAIAMISNSQLGKMMANMFFNMKKQPYPTRMFTDEIEAKAWLKQYL
jgi:hypoxanthine-guanine phosphoribosyltransferase